MNKSDARFLVGILMISVFYATGAIASPRVKVLGTDTGRAETNATSTKAEPANDSSAKIQRLGFIRTQKATNATQGNLVSITKSGTAIEKSDRARAGAEKYVRTTVVSVNTVKPVTEPVSNVDVPSDDFSNLADRAPDLGTVLEQKQVPVDEDLTLENDVVELDEDATEVDNLQDAGDNVDPNTNADFLHGYHVAVPGVVTISENPTNM